MEVWVVPVTEGAAAPGAELSRGPTLGDCPSLAELLRTVCLS